MHCMHTNGSVHFFLLEYEQVVVKNIGYFLLKANWMRLNLHSDTIPKSSISVLLALS